MKELLDLFINTVVWLKHLIHEQFDKLYLAGLFFTGAMILVRWGALPHVADWVEKGVVIGAALMLITGNKKQSAPSDPPQK